MNTVANIRVAGREYAQTARQMVSRVANGGLLKVALGASAAFFTIIVAMLSYWISLQNEIIREMRSEQNLNGNRLTAIETGNDAIRNRLTTIESQLGRIDGNLRELRRD